MKAIVSEKGQVTIPKALRQRLGLKSGTVLEFTEEAGLLVARKKLDADPIDEWVGVATIPDGQTVDEYISSLRES